MPRTTYGTAARAAEAERKRQDAEAKHLEAVGRIIRAEAVMQGLKTDKAIAAAVGMKPNNFGKAMRGETRWTLAQMIRVCDGLGLSNEARAAILGGGKT